MNKASKKLPNVNNSIKDVVNLANATKEKLAWKKQPHILGPDFIEGYITKLVN